MRRLAAPLIALLALAVAGPALAQEPPADEPLSEERYDALEPVFAAWVALDRKKPRDSDVLEVRNLCTALSRDDSLLRAQRTACLRSLAIQGASVGVQECEDLPCLARETSQLAKVTASAVSAVRAANRATDRGVSDKPCRAALKASATELRAMDRLVRALRRMASAAKRESQRALASAERELDAAVKATDRLPSARTQLRRFRRDCG